MDLPPTSLPLSTVAGVAAYVLHFHRGEHHLYPQRNLQALLVVVIVSTITLRHVFVGTSYVQALLSTSKLMVAFLFGLYTSLIGYRMFLNPLNKFPGPPLAKLTAFDLTFRVAKKMDMYSKLYHLHQMEGKFIRTGPNDLSVSDADVVRVAFERQSKCVKAPWYAVEHPAVSLHSTRSRQVHDSRRRVWSPAFSDKALRGYERRVEKYNDSLMDKIASFSGKPVDIAKWFNLWSFDVMGDLAFGRPFGMLDSATQHWAIKLLNETQDGAGIALPPWVSRLLWAVPGLKRSYNSFLDFCSSQIEQRMSVQGKQQDPDITHYLIEDYLSKDPESRSDALPALHLDSKLIIVAGSDTTAATLTFLFYHLVCEPGLLARLREELAAHLGDSTVIEHRKIVSAPLLNGCINEALRLHPPVPSGVYRKTPPEGVQIGSEWIPGNTVIQAHLYSIGREESYFAQANQFIPERFFSRPELIKKKDAFSPFTVGPYSCIGKNLAYMEIRLLTAHLITRFDIALAPGEDVTNFLSRCIDHFTFGLAPLNLSFTERTKVASKDEDVQP